MSPCPCQMSALPQQFGPSFGKRRDPHGMKRSNPSGTSLVNTQALYLLNGYHDNQGFAASDIEQCPGPSRHTPLLPPFTLNPHPPYKPILEQERRHTISF